MITHIHDYNISSQSNSRRWHSILLCGINKGNKPKWTTCELFFPTNAPCRKYPIDCPNFSSFCVCTLDCEASYSPVTSSKHSFVIFSVSFVRVTVLSSVACSLRCVKCFLKAGSAPAPIFMTSPRTSVSNCEQIVRISSMWLANSCRVLSRLTGPRA